MKILIAGLKYDNNLGDGIIFDCTKKLIEQLGNYEVIGIDLTGRCDFEKKYQYSFTRWQGFSFNRLDILRKKHLGSKFGIFLEDKIWSISREHQIYEEHYKKLIQECDAIIIPGGGMIKFKVQQCYQYIDYITKTADRFNKPVMLNAVGVEGYDDNDPRCKRLKKALNRKCVKIITTRDDLDLLNEKYIDNKNIKTAQVCDSAVWSSEIYNVQKKNPGRVGIGLIRPNVFKDYDLNVDERTIINFYKEVIKELINRNIDFEMFTNGAKSDRALGEIIVKEMNLDSSLLPERPKTCEELMELVSKYDGIIAARLHACITSYSLNIPCIGLVWNNKLTMFSEIIGYPNRFFTVDKFNAHSIVDCLEVSIKEGYNEQFRSQYRNSVKQYLKEFVDEIPR